MQRWSLELGQCLRVALPLVDSPENAHAGQASNIADHFWELDVHLFEGLLNLLQMPPGIVDQGRAMALIGLAAATVIGTPHTDRLLGPERGGQ